MSPLVSLTLLGFGTVVVIALLVWTLLSPRRLRPGPPAASGKDAAPPPRSPTVTNDAVRGARVRPPDRPAANDAFDRFLEAGNDDR